MNSFRKLLLQFSAWPIWQHADNSHSHIHCEFTLFSDNLFLMKTKFYNWYCIKWETNLYLNLVPPSLPWLLWKSSRVQWCMSELSPSHIWRRGNSWLNGSFIIPHHTISIWRYNFFLLQNDIFCIIEIEGKTKMLFVQIWKINNKQKKFFLLISICWHSLNLVTLSFNESNKYWICL